MVKKSTKEEFVKKARAVHGDKYIYDDFEYTNAITKGKIICPKHGEFWQSANTHLKGHGCIKCSKENFKKVDKLTFEIFEERAKSIHNGKYSYVTRELSSNKDKVNIICPIHGEFEQMASLHLMGQGCPTCGNAEKRCKMSNGILHFISKANEIHEGIYSYRNIIEYKNNKTKVPIECPKHGIFWQTPFDHVIGRKGCPKCAGRNLTLSDFEKEAKVVHGDNYEYLEYAMSTEKIKIRCKKCGHEFTQVPWSHLQGHGCPYCHSSRLENETRIALENEEINIEEQKSFEWLKYSSNLFLDFYIPTHDLAIECQGRQHFPNSRNFGGKDTYDLIYERDKLKKQLCDEHGVELVYFTHEKVEEPYLGKVFYDVDELMKYIKSKEIN